MTLQELILNEITKTIKKHKIDTNYLTYAEKKHLEKRVKRVVKDYYQDYSKILDDAVNVALKDYSLEVKKFSDVDKWNINNKNYLKEFSTNVSKNIETMQKRIVKSSLDVAKQTINEVSIEYSKGKTIDQAVRIVSNRASRKGIKTVTYNQTTKGNQKQMNVDAFNRMQVRTTIRQVKTQAMFDSAELLETNLIQISAHDGAREKCYPEQGKIFSLDGTSGSFKGIDGTTYSYKPLEMSSYGESDGLFGINCRHTGIPIPHTDKFKDVIKDHIPNKETNAKQVQSRTKMMAERNRTAIRRLDKQSKIDT